MNFHLNIKSDPIFNSQFSEATIRLHSPLTSNVAHVYLQAPLKVTFLDVISRPPAANTMPDTQ